MKTLIAALVLLFTPAFNVHQAVVRWQPGATYAQTVVYRVYRSTNSTTYNQIAQVPLSTLAYTDRNVTPNKTYLYKVSAYDTVSQQEKVSPPISYVCCR
jgi:hypothetical protein